MKKLLLIAFFTIFSLQNCFADQLQLIHLAQATRAVELLKKQTTVVLYCGCCENDPKRAVKVTNVYYKNANSDENGIPLYAVILQGKNTVTNEAINEEIDLAYTHIKNGTSSITVGKFLNYKCDPCVPNFNWVYDSNIQKNRFQTQMSKAVGDLNNDKLNDVVFVMADTIKGDYQIQIYFNDGKGKLNLKTSSMTAVSNQFSDENREIFRSVEIDKGLLKINYAHYNYNNEGKDKYIFKYEFGQFLLTNITQILKGDTMDMDLRTKKITMKEYKNDKTYIKYSNFTLSTIPTLDNFDKSKFKVNQ